MKTRFRGPGRQCISSLLACALAGCATYHPKPLPTAPDLAKAPALVVPAEQFLLPGLKPHPLPPDGLDATTVVMLAVFNDPDLKAARLKEGVARAQMMEAGLLPDPQFSAGYAESARNYGGALALSEDIQALITRGAAKAAASQAEKQVHLDILWQEWQVAAQARQLFIQEQSDRRLLEVLRSNERLLESQYQKELTAMRRGEATAPAVSAELVQLSSVDGNLRQLEVAIDQTNHRLDALLGLQPDVPLHLVGKSQMPEITAAQFQSAIADLPLRRADLLALKAGYRSQEEALRKAILAQFPALSAGLVMQRDPVEGVNDYGPQANLTLPIFNRNRGQIAIQRATRAALRQAYQARLDDAVNQADEVWRSNQILATEIRGLNAQLRLLKQRAAAARKSLQQGDLDSSAYAAMESGYLTTQAEAMQLRASLESGRVALRILLGLPF